MTLPAPTRTPRPRGARRPVAAGALAVVALLASAPGASAGSAAPDAPPRGEPVVVDVISDVQGDLADLERVLDDQAALGLADHLVVNGDLVPTGTQAEYDAYTGVLAAGPLPRRVTQTIGNHETYTGESSEVLTDRFLAETGMPAVYSVQRVKGHPLVHLGTTSTPAGGVSATLGQEQLDWFDGVLDRLPANRPVVVLSHHPLPRTVSGTDWPGSYEQEYAAGEADRLLEIIGDHPNVLFVTGHTHYDLRRDDWMVRKVVEGGDPRGFTAVNGGSVQTTWTRTPDGREVTVDRADHSGIRLEISRDRVRVVAHDFRTDEVVQDETVLVPRR